MSRKRRGDAGPVWHQAYVWDPIDRIRRPWNRSAFDEPVVVRMDWTDEALALLLIIREIISDRVEVARFYADRDPKMFRHYRIGLLARDLIDTVIVGKPKMIVLEPTDFVPYAILMFLDAMVGTLREVGPVTAGVLLRNMGWRMKRAGAYYSPNAYDHFGRQGGPSSPIVHAQYAPPPTPGYAGRPSYYSPYVSGEGAPSYHSPTRGGNRVQSFESPDTSQSPKPRSTFHSPRAK